MRDRARCPLRLSVRPPERRAGGRRAGAARRSVDARSARDPTDGAGDALAVAARHGRRPRPDARGHVGRGPLRDGICGRALGGWPAARCVRRCGRCCEARRAAAADRVAEGAASTLARRRPADRQPAGAGGTAARRRAVVRRGQAPRLPTRRPGHGARGSSESRHDGGAAPRCRCAAADRRRPQLAPSDAAGAVRRVGGCGRARAGATAARPGAGTAADAVRRERVARTPDAARADLDVQRDAAPGTRALPRGAAALSVGHLPRGAAPCEPGGPRAAVLPRRGERPPAGRRHASPAARAPERRRGSA